MDAPLDDRTLRRIIATLVALAVLAERVAGRSFPVRWFVLSLLRRAEAVARAFAWEATLSSDPELDDDPAPGYGPADAALLALRLRLLAAVLGALLGSPDGVAGGNACVVRGRHAPGAPWRRRASSCGWSPWLADTS